MYCTLQYSIFATICSERYGESMGNISNDSLVHPIAAEYVRDLCEIAVRGVSEPKAQSTIRVVHPAELSTETQQTPGSLRMSAIAATHGIVSSIWAGVFVVEPLGKTGIHHHGEQNTVFTSWKERLVCGGASLGNTRSLLGQATFCMCRVGCHTRNSTLRRSAHFDGWLCEVRASRSL